jgi:hypothetical protein
MPDDLTVPVGTRLLHIGPHKTGTTTVQSAFAAAGDRLAEHGVRYFGEEPGVRHLRGALAVTGRRALLGESQPDLAQWTRLVEQIGAATDDRVLISSEFFADADADTARRVVAELGGPRVHVLVTLRPLARIVGSQWQQYVQNGLRTSYLDWLAGMLTKPPYDAPTPTFWQRHRHDRLVARWSDAAGPERVTVVVADERDPAMLLRTFESLLGLPDGFLVAEQGTQNRSLTYGEVEFIRLFNHEFQRRQWPEPVYASYIREGAVRRMKTDYRPAPGETALPTPRWALDRIGEIGTAAAGAIAASGVRVVGDITALGQVPACDPTTDTGPMIAPEAASHALAGVVSTVLAAPQTVNDRRLGELTSREVVRVLLDRGRRRLRRALRQRRR